MNRSPRLLALGACALWSLSSLALGTALRVVPPLATATLALVVAAACFIALLSAGCRARPQGWRWLLLPSVLAPVCLVPHHAGLNVAMQYMTTPAALAWPAVAAVVILARELTALRPLQVTGIVSAVVGALTVVGPDLWSRPRALGTPLLLASAVAFALFTVLGRRALSASGAPAFAAAVTVTAALTLAPIGWLELHLIAYPLDRIPASGWISLAVLGLTSSFLAMLLYLLALERGGPGQVGRYLLTIPPLSAAVLGVTPASTLTLGSILVLGGLLLSERGPLPDAAVGTERAL